MACCCSARAFLNLLRDETRRHGALLIFDEVISGFRLARGGAAEHYGITPDIATFGKIIGGGMPVGAFGASTAIMSRLAPDGDTYQAGTLSGNPVAMAAGIATLDLLEREAAWGKLEARGARPGTAAGAGGRAAPHSRCTWCALGSLALAVIARRTARRGAPARCQRPARRASRDCSMPCWRRGCTSPPSAYEASFVSLAHGESGSAALRRGARCRRGRDAEPMKRTRVFQMTVLLLVVVAAVQVGYWLFDQRSYARASVEAARAAVWRASAAARALLGAGVPVGRSPRAVAGSAVSDRDGGVGAARWRRRC